MGYELGKRRQLAIIFHLLFSLYCSIARTATVPWIFPPVCITHARMQIILGTQRISLRVICIALYPFEAFGMFHRAPRDQRPYDARPDRSLGGE